MNKVTKYTYALRFLSIIFGICMIGLLCLRWFSDMTLFPTYHAELYAKLAYTWDLDTLIQRLHSMSLSTRIAGFFVDGVALGILVLGIIFFNKLIGHIANNTFFSFQSVHVLHILSKIALCGTIYGIIQSTLIAFVIARNQITISVHSGDLINIALFIIFMLLSLIAQEGTQLKQEHDATI